MTQPSWEIQPVFRVRDEYGRLRTGKYTGIDSAIFYYMHEWEVWFAGEYGRGCTQDEYDAQRKKTIDSMSKEMRVSSFAVCSRQRGDYELQSRDN